MSIAQRPRQPDQIPRQRPERRQAPAHLRVEFESVVATWVEAFRVDDATARATVRQGVGLALRCGRPFDFETWVRENRLVRQ